LNSKKESQDSIDFLKSKRLRLVIIRDIGGLSETLGISNMLKTAGTGIEDVGLGRGLLEVIVQRKRLAEQGNSI